MTLDQLLAGTQQLRGIVEAESHRLHDAQDQVAMLTAEQDLLVQADEALKALIAAVQTESHDQVVQLLTFGLQSVFEDLHLAATLHQTNKRGSPWAELQILQRTIEAPILDASGGGPASLVAFLLRVLTIRRAGLAPLILLDEPFSMVSADYVPAVAQLLRDLADKIGLTILMVTHDRRYLDVATSAYEAVDAGPRGTEFRRVS